MDPSGVLRISSIKLGNAKKIKSVTLSFDGHRRKICQARENARDILQENFSSPLLDNKPELLLEIATAGANVTKERVPSPPPHNPEPGQLQPTTEDFLNHRFRLLVIGKSGIGKSTLINHAFGIEQATTKRVEDNRPGTAKIEESLVLPENERFILHDSKGFESGDDANYTAAKNFIQERMVHPDIKEQLHAIWLCFQIPVDEHGERLMERGMEAFLKEKYNIVGKIPTIVVFTKYDRLIDILEEKDFDDAKIKAEAMKHLQKYCIEPIAKLTREREFPYVLVSKRAEFKEMYQQLIELTSKLVSKCFEPRLDSQPSPVPVVTAMAQRVSPQLKIAASIRVGKSRYWRALFSTPEFFGYTVAACLCVIHTDIVNVWNFHDPSRYLMSKYFQERMVELVQDTAPEAAQNSKDDDTEPILPLLPIALPIMAGAALFGWLRKTYERVPWVQQRFIAYIVDLTHILNILFNHTDNEKPLAQESVKIAIKTYSDSPLRAGVHCAIRSYHGELVFGQSLLERIEGLVHDKIEECSSLNPVAPGDLDQDDDWDIAASSCPAE
ncbi:hypothetical protein V8B97DRAFT_2002502 [Scleroderma yunnanense]